MYLVVGKVIGGKIVSYNTHESFDDANKQYENLLSNGVSSAFVYPDYDNTDVKYAVVSDKTLTWHKEEIEFSEAQAIAQEKLTSYAKYRAVEYKELVDPITAEIERLKDEPETPEILAEIAEKITDRNAIVDAIKIRYPKPTV